MIPKIIHLIWFGNDKLSEEYTLHIRNWLLFNPEYQVSCWITANTINETFINSLNSPNIAFRNIHDEKIPSRNYDLIKEMLDSGNILAAVDLFKIDLMVNHGGYYFDLSITPKTPIDDATIDANSLCELEGALSPKTSTRGEYRFHASVKEGELYTLAQDIQRMIIFGLKKDSQSFSVLFCDHPAIKYLATINVTGVAVFLAIDCLLRANKENTAFVTHFEVSSFGIPKKGTKSQHLMSLQQKLSLDRFKDVLTLVYKHVIHIGTGLANKSSSNVANHTLFTQLSSHDMLLSDVKKIISKSAPDLGACILTSVQKKNYSLALRQACAVGNEILVTLFIKYSAQLPIDFNQTSTNGNSPLIWVNLSKADTSVKEKIKILLESAIQSTKQDPDTNEMSSAPS